MSFQSTSYLSLLFNEGVYMIPEIERKANTEVIRSEKIDEAPLQTTSTSLTESFDFIGQNKKRILIITHHRKDSIGITEKEFLLKILAALKLTLDDVAITNSDKLVLEKLKIYFDPRFIIAFTNEKDIEFLIDQKYTFSNLSSIRILRADELSAIESDKAKKTLLWNALKDVLVGI